MTTPAAKPLSSAAARAHVEAAKVAVRAALTRAQRNPSPEAAAEFEAAMRLEESKRDQLDAARNGGQ